MSATSIAYWERYKSTPQKALIGHDPCQMFSVATEAGDDGWWVDSIIPNRLQALVMGVVQEQEALSKGALERVQRDRVQQRRLESDGESPGFRVGDYVSVARVRKLGSAPTLVSTWTGPWRFVSWGFKHVYTVEDILLGSYPGD